MAKILNVNESDFQKEVLESKVPVIVDFYAAWCGPCKMLGPILEEIAEETDKVKIVKVDIDENIHLAQQFGLMSVPTLLIFKEGEEVGKEIGFRQKVQILEIIEKVTK